jgi:tRNA (adenine57-N1/adenine58-N1)-methyltransferase
MNLPRASQIVYPKDIGYILMKLSVAPGSRVIEAGAGSGALTCAFAIYVAPGGRLYSYEARADMLKLARSNVARLGLDQAVTFQQRDVQAEGFDETDVDAVFLDMREPWLALSHAATALANGGFLGTLVPTVNQVVSMAYALERGPFRDVEIAEIMLRQYKTTAERIRPLDRMTAHTGFLLFARKITRAWAGHTGPDGDEGPGTDGPGDEAAGDPTEQDAPRSDDGPDPGDPGPGDTADAADEAGPGA